VPQFLDDTKKLVTILKKRSPAQLMELMGISEDLARLNAMRYKQWKTPFTPKNARPAIFTFDGPVYHGFDFYAYKKPDFERLQKTVRIISGLHGVLKPFDLIQAYRLDFDTPLKNPAGADLYAFWRTKITTALNAEKPDVIVNCASKEYAAAVDFDALNCRVITITFKNFKHGKYQVIGILAKKARGLFADFMVRSNVTKPEQLRLFKAGGYAFDAKTSTENELIFLKKETGMA
jgi:cytoplasmic iron level regulating protein YaaA (DUF328/UPF0246 family)